MRGRRAIIPLVMNSCSDRCGPTYKKDSMEPTLPTGSSERKAIPMATGLLDYFPAALAEVARVSKAGNDKHNPGEPLHWARGKSMDHADTIMRHLVDRGTIDPDDGQLHSAKVAWRALALLQEELEAAGAPVSRGSKDMVEKTVVLEPNLGPRTAYAEWDTGGNGWTH